MGHEFFLARKRLRPIGPTCLMIGTWPPLSMVSSNRITEGIWWGWKRKGNKTDRWCKEVERKESTRKRNVTLSHFCLVSPKVALWETMRAFIVPTNLVLSTKEPEAYAWSLQQADPEKAVDQKGETHPQGPPVLFHFCKVRKWSNSGCFWVALPLLTPVASGQEMTQMINTLLPLPAGVAANEALRESLGISW